MDQDNTTDNKIIEKKLDKLMDNILKSQNQVTKLMVSCAIDAAELKMAYTKDVLKNLEAIAKNPDNK